MSFKFSPVWLLSEDRDGTRNTEPFQRLNWSNTFLYKEAIFPLGAAPAGSAPTRDALFEWTNKENKLLVDILITTEHPCITPYDPVEPSYHPEWTSVLNSPQDDQWTKLMCQICTTTSLSRSKSWSLSCPNIRASWFSHVSHCSEHNWRWRGRWTNDHGGTSHRGKDTVCGFWFSRILLYFPLSACLSSVKGMTSRLFSMI